MHKRRDVKDGAAVPGLRPEALLGADADGAVAPPWRLYVREWLTVAELATAHRKRASATRWPRGDGHPVLVLPGFLAGAFSTRYLRRFLRRQGYYAYDWAQGRNLGLREGLEDDMTGRLQQIVTRHGRRASLIGWSAGGIYAREIARKHPELVRDVITLGSPFRGNHKASRAWRAYRLLNRGPTVRELMSEEARAARAECLPVPTTCIYSRYDGIVAWQCCTSLPCPRTENVEVVSTHLGYGHNLHVLRVIADRLARPEERASTTCSIRREASGE